MAAAEAAEAMLLYKADMAAPTSDTPLLAGPGPIQVANRLWNLGLQTGIRCGWGWSLTPSNSYPPSRLRSHFFPDQGGSQWEDSPEGMKVAQLAEQHLQAPKSHNASSQTGCAPACSAGHAGQLVARSAAHCLPAAYFC